jgi:hypothetical protein
VVSIKVAPLAQGGHPRGGGGDDRRIGVEEEELQEHQVPVAVDLRPLPMTRPGRTCRRKLTLSWRVDWNWSGSSVASRAGPTVSYSIAATKARARGRPGW